MGRISKVKIDDKLAMKLYNEGMGWREIGRILKIHPYQVQIHFEKLGLKAHNPVGGVRTWDSKKALDMNHCGCSVKQIAKELEVSESTIYTFFRKLKKEGMKNEEDCDCNCNSDDFSDCSCNRD
jgi:DNA-binding CsgD family transcriptional regulator